MVGSSKCLTRKHVDVISLCASVPDEFVRMRTWWVWHGAFRLFLTTYQDHFHARFKKKFVLVSVNVILKKSTSVFDPEVYWEIRGTAMSRVSGATYANLTMGYRKIKVYFVIH